MIQYDTVRSHSFAAAQTADKSTLILVRHGESTWNLENKFTGWVDVPLSPKGHEEVSIGMNAASVVPVALNSDIANCFTDLIEASDFLNP